MDMGAHRLSQLRLYAQSEPTRIAATVRKYMSDPNRISEDWAHALIDFDSGAVGIYETSRLGEAQRYCQITGTLGGIVDGDTFGPEIPLRLLQGEEWRDVPVETERRRIDGVDVLQRIVVHTDTPIVYDNPFRNYAIDDWCVGHAAEIMSIANAALNDEPAEYGIEGRKDVEMAMAIYESSLNGMAPIALAPQGRHRLRADGARGLPREVRPSDRSVLAAGTGDRGPLRPGLRWHLFGVGGVALQPLTGEQGVVRNGLPCGTPGPLPLPGVVRRFGFGLLALLFACASHAGFPEGLEFKHGIAFFDDLKYPGRLHPLRLSESPCSQGGARSSWPIRSRSIRWRPCHRARRARRPGTCIGARR